MVVACRGALDGGTFRMVRFLLLPMTPDHPRLIPPLALALVLFGLSACNLQPSVSLKVTDADGEELEVPLSSVPPPVTDGVVTVKSFTFAPWDMGPDKPKALTFSFIVGFADGAVPKSIVIDDFTEQPVLQVFADMNAHVVKDHLWGAVSVPYAPQDEHVKWVLNLDNNVRVYRFTIILKDGSKHVLLKPIFIPSQMKVFMRTQLGINN